MSFNWKLKVPYGYGTSKKTLSELEAIMKPHYHPAYLRRLLAWLHAQGGKVGVGGHWRATGSQPDRPGFAPEGRSFHQDQTWSDGTVGAAAVDLVVKRVWPLKHRAPTWDEVPAQHIEADFDEIMTFGVHVNTPTESWHMQPIISKTWRSQVDGWATWKALGSPSPDPGFNPPIEHDPYPPTPNFPGDAMFDFVTERRLLDTRNTGRPFNGQTLTITVPEAVGKKGVKVTLAAVSPTKGGHLRAWPRGFAMPGTSKLNFGVGWKGVANTTDVAVNDQGQFHIFVQGKPHVLVDLVGVWS